ncbi:transketolase, putative [Entamoeba invadens IP1]|uniref:transketolase n=1 Tax=Entamoeba invadens IP1 TaxID=370355 RepID=A0A0A1UAR3_ENTIV|nr:transketolase, putative [Entamoeba invadens IP1]ELP89238.1 transketolase, putative [Entamoeba invadens IP1]|eukprot:XP_004256009.1 transketolase, putative [Entamoeba invadens IP1]
MADECIKTIRMVACEMINKANSGHPGVPTGCAAIAYTLYTRHLKFTPKASNWLSRDRFVLSNGHGSSLLYLMNHLCGYKVSLDDLKQFRQLDSLTPGHPEYHHTDGVEVTTGPLGAGMATAVGLAIAERHMAAEFNKPNYELVNNYTYVLLGDGCLMEGVTSEASSLAGHLKLNKLICLYDDNHITIDGDTSLAFTENVKERYEAYGWNVLHCDGNCVEQVNAAITLAKSSERPTLIMCKTLIGCGLPNKQGTCKAHGEPPGADLNLMKENYKMTEEFKISETVYSEFHGAAEKGAKLYDEWETLYTKYASEYPKEYAELERRIKRDTSKVSSMFTEELEKNEKGEATRISSCTAFKELAKELPETIGGTADLGASVKVVIPGKSFDEGYDGRNIHFGIREHAMGNITNGISIYGGLIGYCSTFFVFSDYLRPTVRLAALSGYPAIYVFTHDSIGVGEDGPTHQPIEHLMSFRAMPNVVVLRPSDANETRVAWKFAVQHKTGPTLLIFARQNSAIIDRKEFAKSENLLKGAYVLKDFGTPKVILIATGTEVDLAIKAAKKLETEGVGARVVSMPSWELFEQQTKEYKESVLPRSIRARVSVEAGATFGWEKYIGMDGVAVGMNSFGASAPIGAVYKKFGITEEHVVEAAKISITNSLI